MKPTAKRALSLLVSAALLMAAFAVYGLFIRSAYDEVIELRGELNSRDQFLREQNFILSKVDDLMTQYQGATQLQDTVSLSLPLGEDLSSIFNQLRVLASVNNLTLEVFGVKPLAFRESASVALADRIGSLQLSLRAAGPYEGFKNFLKNIETNIRVMDVQSVAIEELGSSSSNYFAYNLIINTYYQE